MFAATPLDIANHCVWILPLWFGVERNFTVGRVESAEQRSLDANSFARLKLACGYRQVVGELTASEPGRIGWFYSEVADFDESFVAEDDSGDCERCFHFAQPPTFFKMLAA